VNSPTVDEFVRIAQFDYWYAAGLERLLEARNLAGEWREVLEHKLVRARGASGWFALRPLEVVNVERDEEVTTLSLRCAQGQPLPTVEPGQVLSLAFGAHEDQRVLGHHYAVSQDPERPGAYRVCARSALGSEESSPGGFLSSRFPRRLDPGDVVLAGAPRRGLDASLEAVDGAEFWSEGIGISGVLSCILALPGESLPHVRVTHHRGSEPLERLEREFSSLARARSFHFEVISGSFSERAPPPALLPSAVFAYGPREFVDELRRRLPPDHRFQGICFS